MVYWIIGICYALGIGFLVGNYSRKGIRESNIFKGEAPWEYVLLLVLSPFVALMMATVIFLGIEDAGE